MSRYEPIEEETGSVEQNDQITPNEGPKVNEKIKRNRKKNFIKTVIVTIIVLLIGAITALLLLFFLPNFDPASQYYKDLFVETVDPAEIKKEFLSLAEKPHLAGTNQDYLSAVATRDKWQSYGIQTKIETTSVLLTYPKSREVIANFVDGTTFNCTLNEDVVPDGTSGDPSIVPPWVAWSASGIAEGELVYVNYGRQEDFDMIQDVNLTGKIVIVRYGKIFRGDKVKFALKRGAVGVLLYTDPEDTGYVQGKTYPEGPWSSNSTMQRGSIWAGNGDPQTPGWPSVDDGPRLSIDDAKDQKNSPWQPLPSIPVQPLSAKEAEPLLRALNGTKVPNSTWAGAFNIGFIGPGSVRVRISIEVEYKTTPIWNVIGLIKGDIETDRLAIIGCHRDAWVFGAGDPVSGHAVLNEVARGLGHLVQRGWTPRRSVLIASWDAEEYGLIGSIEWAEKWAPQLSTQAVAYLNLDAPVRGLSSLDVTGTPSLTKLFGLVAQRIKYKEKTLYDLWPSKKLEMLGAGSDNAVFSQHLGIPTLYIDSADPIGEAVYHSAYDSIYWMEKFGDPDFEAHASMTQLYGLLLMNLADNLILPFDFTDYASMMNEAVIQYSQTAAGNVNFAVLANSISYLNTASKFLVAELIGFKSFSANAMKCERVAYRLQNLNSRLFKAERGFLGDQRLSGHGWYKHVISSPSKSNQYGGVVSSFSLNSLGTAFPALADAIATKDWKEAQFLVARLAIMINNTAEAISQKFLDTQLRPIS